MKEYGETFWRTLIKEHSQSSLTARQFCEERGIAISTFNRWKSKLQNTEVQGKEDFVEVLPKPTVEKRTPQKNLIIRTSYGYTIEVPL
jgi:hypothetical protein